MCSECQEIAAANPPRASIVIVHWDGRVLSVTSRKYGGRCLPGGKLEYGETPEQCAMRELYEETGLECAEEDLIPIAEWNGTAEPTRIVSVFFCSAASGVPHDVEEGTNVAWMKWEDFAEEATGAFKPFYENHFPRGVAHFVDSYLEDLEDS